MPNNKEIDFALLEGQTFIVGRAGNIFIRSPQASKFHAELKIVNGKVHLRDLNSTNGCLASITLSGLTTTMMAG
jgi:hypothetical protein